MPLNKSTMTKNAIALALYNEVFINGQKNIGDGNSVELFDRNRLYLGTAYVLNSKFKFQLGYMFQTTNAVTKGQLQLSVHHNF